MAEREEILKALQVIKSTCEQYDDCEKCPLRVQEGSGYWDWYCGVKSDDNPSEWKIKPQEESWRAFES